MNRDLLYDNLFGIPKLRIKETDDEFTIKMKKKVFDPEFRRVLEMFRSSAREAFVGVILRPFGLHSGTAPECGRNIAAFRRFAQLGKAGNAGKDTEYIARQLQICRWRRRFAPARVRKSLTLL